MHKNNLKKVLKTWTKEQRKLYHKQQLKQYWDKYEEVFGESVVKLAKKAMVKMINEEKLYEKMLDWDINDGK